MHANLIAVSCELISFLFSKLCLVMHLYMLRPAMLKLKRCCVAEGPCYWTSSCNWKFESIKRLTTVVYLSVVCQC